MKNAGPLSSIHALFRIGIVVVAFRKLRLARRPRMRVIPAHNVFHVTLAKFCNDFSVFRKDMLRAIFLVSICTDLDLVLAVDQERELSHCPMPFVGDDAVLVHHFAGDANGMCLLPGIRLAGSHSRRGLAEERGYWVLANMPVVKNMVLLSPPTTVPDLTPPISWASGP